LADGRAGKERLRKAGGILPGEILESEFVKPGRPGLWKAGTLPGGSPVTLNPKGSTGTDSVTAMYREASHPDYDYLFSQNPAPELRKHRELLQQEFWKDLEVPW
jgi:hypothetical protein